MSYVGAPVVPVYRGLFNPPGVTSPVQSPDGMHYGLNLKWKWTQKLRGDWTTIIENANAGFYFRGTISGDWIIGESRLQLEKGQVGTVEIDWESIASGLSPDEWEVTRENLQPHLERNSYFSNLSSDNIAIVKRAFNAFSAEMQATASNQFASCLGLDGSSTEALCWSLLDKLEKGMESYYLAASRYTWSTYYLPGDVPALFPGGYIDPSPGGPAGYVLPANTAWLREADQVGQANYAPIGGIVKLTRTWIGGPLGWWDTNLYPTIGG
jgi:hypothetical protein